MKKRFEVFACFVLVLTMSLAGEVTPVTWGNINAKEEELTSSESTAWGVATNWLDAGGEALALAPTNAADQFAVTLTPFSYSYYVNDANQNVVTNQGYRKLITTGTWSGADANVYLQHPAVDPSIASIAGPACYLISHTVTSSYKQQKARVFTVADPNAFWGWWTTGDANAWFRLTATESFIPTLQGLSAKSRPYIDVPTAGTTAAVAALAEGGTLNKMGAGKLIVGPSSDPSVGFIAEEGTLELRGEADGELKRILSTAALHLDADDESTLVYTNVVEEPGYTFIDRWNDVRGNGNYAYFPNYRYGNPSSQYAIYYFPYTLPPFVSPATSPTGRRLVDFGSRFADKGELGPSNCVMRLKTDVNGISDAFVVEWDPKGGADVTLLGGIDGLTLDYNRKGIYLWGPSQYQLNNGFKTCEVIFNDNVYYWNDPALRYASISNLFTACFSSEATGRVQALGSDRYYMSRSNRTRTGEIILFTNSLSRAERLLVSRYLEEKWRTGEPRELSGYSAVVSAGVKLAVDEGRTAYLATVNVTNGTLVKTGAGTLAVDQLSPAGTAINLEAGNVKFSRALGAPTTTAPAEDAYIWLDAADGTDFDFEADSNTRVTAWRDHRAGQTGVATARDDQNKGNLPTVRHSAVGGKSVVSMGLVANGEQTFFALPTWNENTKHVYAGFMVMRPLTAGSSSRNYFGSSDLTMMRNSGYGILSATYKQGDALAARWTLNGDVVDPMARQDAYTRQTNDFFVLAFLSSKPLVMNAINKDRRNQQHSACGDIEVGEVIVYHRKLGLEEFRDTEAYLMKKWLGKDHPASGAAAVGKIAVAEGQDALVDADRDVVIGEVSASGAVFVKKGAGTAEVKQMPLEVSPSALAVEGGTLKPTFGFNPDSSALFHFDAKDASSLRLWVSDDQTVTNVTRWYDTRNAGIYARSEWDAQTSYAKDAATSYAFAVTNPALVTVTTTNDVKVPALYFGLKRNCTNDPKLDSTSKDAAAMRFYDANAAKNKDGSDASKQFDTVKETFVVAARRGYANNIIGAYDSSAYSDSRRGQPNGGNYMCSGTLINKDYSYPTLTNDAGTVFINGESVKGTTYTLEDDVFKLIEFRPGEDTRVSALALDRNCNAGGCYICEVIGFGRVLSDAERADLRAQLMSKWFALELPERSFESVQVAAGATLDMEGVDISVVSLAGGGTLRCGALTLTGSEQAAEIAVSYRSAQDVDCLTLTSPAAFPNGVKVTVSFEGTSWDEVEVGEWPILVSPGLTLDDAQISYEHDYTGPRRVSVYRDGNALKLRILPRGTTLIFR